MKKIIVIGSSNIDIVISVPHIPAVGETILATSVDFFCGGKGANQAAAVAKLGGDIAMIGCVGNDGYGKLVTAQLSGFGVDTRGLKLLEGVQTGNAYINVSQTGENNIVVNPGANSHVTGDLIDKHRFLMEGAAYCIIQLEIPIPTLYRAAEICREMGIRLILNPAPAAELDFERLQGTYMIAPNESELDLLVPGDGNIPKKARMLYDKGFENVLVTLGNQGSLLINGQSEKVFPIHDAYPALDTTAAGDSFIGALAFGLARDQELEESIRLATVAAAITVSRPGAQPSLPSLKEVEAHLWAYKP